MIQNNIQESVFAFLLFPNETTWMVTPAAINNRITFNHNIFTTKNTDNNIVPHNKATVITLILKGIPFPSL